MNTEELIKAKDKEIKDLKCVVNHLDKKISDLIKHFGITTEQLIDMLSNEQTDKKLSKEL